MKLHSWVSTCSIPSITTDDAPPPPPPLPPPPPQSQTPPSEHLLYHASSSSPDMQGSASTTSNISSLQSNLSLQTLPSLPSLQKLSPDNSSNLSTTPICISSLKTHHGHVNFLSVNQNLLYAASGSVINVFDITNSTLVDKFNAGDPSSGSVKSIAFRDGKIFTAHQDCKIRAWKLTSNKKHKLIATLPALKDRLKHFLLPNNYVKVRRHRKKLWVEHHDAVTGLAVTENLLYSVSWDRCLKIWSAKGFKCMGSLQAHDDAINAVVVGYKGRIIYTGSADKKIKVWERSESSFGDQKKYVLIATMAKHKSAVNALALSVDGSLLFSGSNDRSILVWEREDSADHMVVSGALRGHGKGVLCLVVNASSGLLFSGSADRTVRIWQPSSNGKYCCLGVLGGHETPVRSVVAVGEYSGEEGGAIKVFSGSFDGEVKLWQVYGFE